MGSQNLVDAANLFRQAIEVVNEVNDIQNAKMRAAAMPVARLEVQRLLATANDCLHRAS